jgi:hypothetical protein
VHCLVTLVYIYLFVISITNACGVYCTKQEALIQLYVYYLCFHT